MSLFICENCGCIENTNCMQPHQVEKSNPNYVRNDEFPNMLFMQMQGCGNDKIFVGAVMDYQWKKKDEILMLCSECNTGTWHNEFDKKFPEEWEKEYSKYSRYNFITYNTQPVRPDTFKMLYNSDRYDHFKEKLDAAYRNGATLIYDSDIDEILYESEYRRKYRKRSKMVMSSMLGGLCAMNGTDFEELIDSYIPKPSKPHWKETQSQLEKEKKLKLAELKRQIKKNKKLKIVDNSLIDEFNKLKK